MQSKDLVVGGTYWAEYYKEFWKPVPGRPFEVCGPSESGYAMLLRKNAPVQGWHTLVVDSKEVFAASKSILIRKASDHMNLTTDVHALDDYADSVNTYTDALNEIITKINEISPGAIDQPVVEVPAEAKLLQDLGFDDNTRRMEMQIVVTFLEGLGVTSVPDDNFTSLTIPYKDIATLKAVVRSIYRQDLANGE
jgi:hypothetical protein